MPIVLIQINRHASAYDSEVTAPTLFVDCSLLVFTPVVCYTRGEGFPRVETRTGICVSGMGLNVPTQNVPPGEHQKGETAHLSSIQLICRGSRRRV